jgi:hypothetical protein
VVRRWTQSITDDDAVRLVRHKLADAVGYPEVDDADVPNERDETADGRE